MIFKYIPSFYLGWNLGSNDSANVFGPQVNSGIIRYWNAVILTSIFLFAGALIEGRKGFTTISGISRIDLNGVIIISLSAGLVVNLMSYLGLPVSVTQGIIGSIIGISILKGNPVAYTNLIKIFISWIINPFGAAIIAFILYQILARIWLIRSKNLLTLNFTIKWSSIFIGCYAAYSLGANNLANITGPLVGAGIMSPFMASVFGGISISAGVLTYSRKVMYTIGKQIAPLEPLSTMVVVLSEAITLHIFTAVGVPISSSQAIVGAVVGAGLVKGIGSLNRRTLIIIPIGWVSTIAGSGVMACILEIITRIWRN